MNTAPQRTLPASVRTLPQLFAWRVATTPRAEAYRQFNLETSSWVSTSWAEAGERVARWTEALARLDLPRGARIAILLPNGLDAVCIDQATLALACVPVPLHALDNPASIAYILSDSDAVLLVTTSDTQWQAIASVQLPLPALRLVVVTQPAPSTAPESSTPPVRALHEWLPAADTAQTTDAMRHAAPAEQDLAGLVYTSGTTGKPKGVMLTHANVMSNVTATLARVAPSAHDVLLSFLPLSHTFERTAGYYLPIAAGCCVAFARSVALLAEDLKTVRPTILISVPRVYERVHSKLQEMLATSKLKSQLFAWAEAVGWRRFCRQQGLPIEHGGLQLLDRLAWRLLEPLVARPMLARFGGRLRVAVSGGAPLSQPVAHCFLGLGLPIVQGYGMTETSPIVAANAPQDNDPATVGRPLAGVEVRIGDNLELQVRGPNVMRGYWKREEETARAFRDGWFCTGDQAAIENGRIRILGRLKEIIVTSTGEKIAPADLELAISADPLFEQAYVFGDNRPFIACIVVLNRAEWERLAQSLQLDAALPASLADSTAREAALARIKSLTHSFPYYAQPRAVWLTREAWTPENTLMTPTLKIKRNNLAAHFAAQMAALYQR
ncbi:MAG: long-chain fatty acid--CoA ligase [Rhodoferax sp.]|uniref:AMP-dependent synthetase/ligase n=1 Tax=Rhodoferax sp. TaxID=50421 RepID=UPI00181F7C4F|nr:long-chain fatty acid--CoA ligase [Rhodoferax sp.]NMM11994.1 long-chain fatty acid--CoA ligase [Rhodoferax sp.]